MVPIQVPCQIRSFPVYPEVLWNVCNDTYICLTKEHAKKFILWELEVDRWVKDYKDICLKEKEHELVAR